MRSIRDPKTGELRDSLSRDWTKYLERLGVTVIPVANDLSDPAAHFRALSPDALLLTNGEDVGSHPPRDGTERALVDAARSDDTPVLGICRGHQFINDYYGGDLVTLHEHMQETPHAGDRHDVEIRDGPVENLLPTKLTVNSYHDMGIIASGIAPDLRQFATARGTDEPPVIEGLYHPTEPVLSLQWHPERPLPTREPVDELLVRFLGGELRW